MNHLRFLIISILCFSSASFARSSDKVQHWLDHKVSIINCREPDTVKKNFERSVVDSLALLEQINPGLVKVIESRLYNRLDVSCESPAGSSEGTKASHEEGFLWQAARISIGTLSFETEFTDREKAYVFHEFLHFARIENVHNPLHGRMGHQYRKREDGRRNIELDVTYACSQAIYPSLTIMPFRDDYDRMFASFRRTCESARLCKSGICIDK